MPDESVMVEEEAKEKQEGEKREIGKLAVWTVSSNKPGNGVEMLRDNNLTTYWQSDGAQPHLVNIQFQKKVRLQQVAIYVDFKVDESYTPNKIAIRAGNSFHDLREIKVVDLVEPTGWVHISLCSNDSKDFLRAFFMQLAVLSNHQNGRDTHIRQIKIYGPRQAAVIGHPFEFTTIEFSSKSTIR